MKLKASELRKLIKEEFSRSVPEFAIKQIAEECAEDVKRLVVNHINAKSTSQQERQQSISQMNIVMQDLEVRIKDLIDEKLSEFFNKSR
jgi:hypothetical protein